MGYQYLDMEEYRRKDHFAYFSGLAYPYVGVTVNADITGLPENIKEKQLPFFLTINYLVSQAANGVREFRQRILDGIRLVSDLSYSSFGRWNLLLLQSGWEKIL